MARLAMVLAIISSLFLLSLARHPIDLPTQTQITTPVPEEFNTISLTLDLNQSTGLDIRIRIVHPTKKEVEGETQPSNLALLDKVRNSDSDFDLIRFLIRIVILIQTLIRIMTKRKKTKRKRTKRKRRGTGRGRREGREEEVFSGGLSRMEVELGTTVGEAGVCSLDQEAEGQV